MSNDDIKYCTGKFNALSVQNVERMAEEIRIYHAKAEVEAIQTMLTQKNIPVGEIDGVMGDKTQNGLTSYIAEIQKDLIEKGVYSGPIDGKYTQELRDYAQNNPDGMLSEVELKAFTALNTMQDHKFENGLSGLDIAYQPAPIREIIGLESYICDKDGNRLSASSEQGGRNVESVLNEFDVARTDNARTDNARTDNARIGDAKPDVAMEDTPPTPAPAVLAMR